jgi:hypothetical protein
VAAAAAAFALLWLFTLLWFLGRHPPNAHKTSGSANPASPRPDLKRALADGDLGDIAETLCAAVDPPAADIDALRARIADRDQRAALDALQRARWAGGDPRAAREALRRAFAAACASTRPTRPAHVRDRCRRSIPRPEPRVKVARSAGGSAAQESAWPRPARKRLPLHTKIAIGFIAGIRRAWLVHATGAMPPGCSASRLRHHAVLEDLPALIFMLIVPLLFSALVVGVAEMGDVRALGRIGWKTLFYTVVLSAVAVLLGLVLVNWLKPGAGVDPALAQQLLADNADRAKEIVASVGDNRAASTCWSPSCPTTWSRRPRTTARSCR